MVPIHHGWLWFPSSPGLVSGIILGGFGCGGLIFDNVWTHVINPDNLSEQDDGYYDPTIDDRFMSTWRLTVSCWLLLAVIGFAMIFPGPVKEKKSMSNQGNDESADEVEHSSDHVNGTYVVPSENTMSSDNVSE